MGSVFVPAYLFAHHDLSSTSLFLLNYDMYLIEQLLVTSNDSIFRLRLNCYGDIFALFRQARFVGNIACCEM